MNPQTIQQLTQQAQQAQQQLDNIYKQRGLRYDPTTKSAVQLPQVNTSINAGQIGTTKAIPIVPTPPPSKELGTLNDAFTAEVKTGGLPVNQEREELKTSLADYVKGLSGESAETAPLAADAETKRLKAQTMFNEIDEFDKQFREEVKAIRAESGGLLSGQNAKIAQAQQVYEDTRANKALSYRIASQDSENATRTLNDKVNALKDQNAQKLEVFRLQASLMSNDLTESESMQVASNYRIKEKEMATLEDAYQSAMVAGQENGASEGYFNALDTAKRTGNVASLMSVTTRYGYKTLDQKIKEENLRKSASGDVDIKLTPEKRTRLLGSGFTSVDITGIEKDINTHGIKKVLENQSLTTTQRLAISEVYGGETVLSEVETALTPKVTKKWWQFWK